MFWLMDWQETLALSLVAVTAVVFAGQLFRRKGLGKRRGATCGCVTAPRLGSTPVTIVCRSRRGEPSRWIVREASNGAMKESLAAPDHFTAA